MKFLHVFIWSLCGYILGDLEPFISSSSQLSNKCHSPINHYNLQHLLWSDRCFTTDEIHAIQLYPWYSIRLILKPLVICWVMSLRLLATSVCIIVELGFFLRILAVFPKDFICCFICFMPYRSGPWRLAVKCYWYCRTYGQKSRVRY